MWFSWCQALSLSSTPSRRKDRGLPRALGAMTAGHASQEARELKQERDENEQLKNLLGQAELER